MKARLTAKGDLFIVPENETEAYALSCWWRAFQEIPTAARRPAFGIDGIADPVTSGAQDSAALGETVLIKP